MSYKPLSPAQARAFDAWHFLNKDLSSPDSYITMGLYYMISTALQRRVWFGNNDALNPYRLFPNVYNVLVGPPAIGKSMIMRQINSCLKHHKQSLRVESQSIGPQLNERGELVGVSGTHNIRPQEPKLLIPVAPESITAEELFRVMNDSILCASYTDANGKTQRDVFKSLALVIEELSMLFKATKETKTLISFLLLAFDCGDFEHATKTQGHDKIRKMCMNLFAGVQPSCLNDLSNSFLLGEGFASRVVFIFEVKPRFYKFGTINFCREQYAAKQEIIDHIKRINSLYGEIKYSKAETPEAWEILRAHIEDVIPFTPSNNHQTLAHYYGRKEIHAKKLATAIHFSYSTEMTLFPEDCQFALDILEDLEVRMHHALTFSKNPLAGTSRKVYDFLKKNGPVSKNDLLVHFYDEVRLPELDEMLCVLLQTEKATMRRTAGGEIYSADTKDAAPLQIIPTEVLEPSQSLLG